MDPISLPNLDGAGNFPDIVFFFFERKRRRGRGRGRGERWRELQLLLRRH